MEGVILQLLNWGVGRSAQERESTYENPVGNWWQTGYLFLFKAVTIAKIVYTMVKVWKRKEINEKKKSFGGLGWNC